MSDMGRTPTALFRFESWWRLQGRASTHARTRLLILKARLNDNFYDFRRADRKVDFIELSIHPIAQRKERGDRELAIDNFAGISTNQLD